MKSIILVPYGGLCNRLRVIASGVSVAKKINAKLTIIWHKIPECYIEYHKLFNDIPNVQILEYSKRKYLWPSKKNLFIPLLRKINFFQNYYWELSAEYKGDFLKRNRYRKSNVVTGTYDLDSIFRKKKNIVVTCQVIDTNFDLSIFKPTLLIDNKINRLFTFSFENVYGIHIRRTDNKKSIENSPIELFVSKINEIISDDSDAFFFLASDDFTVKEFLISLFGKKIITYQAKLERNSEEGMIDAAVELFLLSKTKKIFGSYWSSYTDMAAKIGNIDLEVLNIKS